jgi:hypothetical protein
LYSPSDPNHRATTLWHTARIPDEHPPTSRQADRLRTHVANVESGIEVIMEQVARLQMREEVWCAVLMGMLGGAAVTIVFALAFFATEALAPLAAKTGQSSRCRTPP